MMSLTLSPACSSTDVPPSPAQQADSKESIMKGSLSALKDYKYRDEFMRNNWYTPVRDKFSSLEKFFQCIDAAHEDTLRTFKVNQLFKGDLAEFLKSNYAPLSDQEFVECNGFDVDWKVEKCVAKRLSHIQQHRHELIFPTDTTDGVGFFGSFFVQKISLKQIRHLDTEAKINRVFSKHSHLLILLSPDQKMNQKNLHHL
jgi:hypothetical protein